MNIPTSSLPGRTLTIFQIQITIHLLQGIAVIELQFYHFPDSDRLRVGSVTD